MGEATTTGFAVKQSVEIAAPRERVFELLTDEAQLRRWMAVTVFEPRVGGRFELVKGEHHAVGELTEIDPPRLVAYTWDWRDQPLGVDTEVRFELEEKGGGTVLHLTHTGFAAEEQQAAHDHGWGYYVDRLKTVAEGGDPGPDTMGE